MNEKNTIDDANDSLYRQGALEITKRHNDAGFESALGEEDPSKVWPPPVPKSFITPENKEKINEKINIYLKRVFIAAIIFFVLSLGVAAAIYIYGNTTISAKNINVEITSPPSVPSSDTFSFDVSVQNGNNSPLINTAIIVDYPEGTRNVDDNSKPLISERIEIGNLGSGEIAKRTVSARLFGKENDEKNIRVRFAYEIENSNAKFNKDTDFDVVLRVAPVVLSVDALREVNNNQEVVLKAKVISNSNNTLNNIALNIVYPFGFSYSRSNFELESAEKGLFPLGELKPNETKNVEIYGTINGESSEDKVFKFNVGTADRSDLEKVSTTLSVYNHDMTIRGDFLASNLLLDSGKNYTSFDQSVRGVISWRNTLSDPINDAEFSLKISGDLINLNEVSSGSGFFDSKISVIKWNKGTDDALEEIPSGQTGRFSFAIPLYSYEEAVSKKITNPKVNLTLDIEGRRITENNVTETIRSSFMKVVPVITTVDFKTQTLFRDGPLKNIGTHPAKAENKTTYTIALSLSNTVNQITDGEVVAKLPNYVTYEGEVSPKSEKVSFNQTTRQLRWDIGTIPVRAGHDVPPKVLYFKVGISPSKTQIGKVPELVTDISFVGRDNHANAEISEIGSEANTAISDKSAGFGGNQVVE